MKHPREHPLMENCTHPNTNNTTNHHTTTTIINILVIIINTNTKTTTIHTITTTNFQHSTDSMGMTHQRSILDTRKMRIFIRISHRNFSRTGYTATSNSNSRVNNNIISKTVISNINGMATNTTHKISNTKKGGATKFQEFQVRTEGTGQRAIFKGTK
eukprot:comp19953_c1_seq1/m.24302 comp19953_c1_seq1/g.24302  ORF comp19953_c1_seq1/g.24302 comp19953_c1_seq1/m.24302 type:complete len:158 (-) comp19953_c1_seq1:141-614(-)